MQALIELAPLVAFFAAYRLAGIYVATAVLMGSMAALLALDYARTRRITPLHGASAVLVLLFGTATLVLHDQRFIEWKPTVLFWALALVHLGSTWIGAKPLAQRLLESTLGGEAALPRGTWVGLNLAWVAFYAALGALNLWVAWNASEATWVSFKAFGLTGAMFVFVLAQALWLSRQQAVPAAEAPVDP